MSPRPKPIWKLSTPKLWGKPDKDVIAQPELLQRINNFLAAVDAAFTSLNGTIKSVKTSVDS